MTRITFRPVKTTDYKQVQWSDSPIPEGFKGMIDKAWYLTGKNPGEEFRYLALILRQRGTERCLSIVHLAGENAPRTEKFDTVEAAMERVLQTATYFAVIPRVF